VKFSTKRVFSESLYRVIDGPFQTKKKWSELFSEFNMKPLFIIGDVIVLKRTDVKPEKIIINATVADLYIDAMRNNKPTRAIVAGAVHENHQSLISIYACWYRSDKKRRAQIEKQFLTFSKTWTDEDIAAALEWNKTLKKSTKSKTGCFLVSKLRSLKNGKS
jgi:hypothetical protein